MFLFKKIGIIAIQKKMINGVWGKWKKRKKEKKRESKKKKRRFEVVIMYYFTPISLIFNLFIKRLNNLKIYVF